MVDSLSGCERGAGLRLRHGYEEMGSPVAWASCLGAEGPKDTRRLVQVALVPGTVKPYIVTGNIPEGGVEATEVAISWMKLNENSILEALGLEAFPRPLGTLFETYGLHVHILPAHFDKDVSLLAVTIALALLSLASGRRCDESIAILGSLREDGARLGRVKGLSEGKLERCLAQGISHLVVGVEQVSR